MKVTVSKTNLDNIKKFIENDLVDLLSDKNSTLNFTETIWIYDVLAKALSDAYSQLDNS
jgi:hypothetical protein